KRSTSNRIRADAGRIIVGSSCNQARTQFGKEGAHSARSNVLDNALSFFGQRLQLLLVLVSSLLFHRLLDVFDWRGKCLAGPKVNIFIRGRHLAIVISVALRDTKASASGAAPPG